MKDIIICTSERLRTTAKTACVAEAIFAALDSLHVKHLELKNTNNSITNSIDLIPIIWQNIILEVPLKVISPNVQYENLKGDGWKFITEEEVNNKDIEYSLM